MSAERWYRLLLRAYPPAFRARYAQEMLLAFRQCRRDAVESVPRFWAAMLWDGARSAPALRLEAMRARWSMDLHITEGAMKAMAILATLIGALEVVNSLIEGVGGGVHRPATQLLSVGLGVAGGIVLMGAGILMLRRGTHAFPRVLGMSAACLAAFALIALVAPVMSGAAMILGIGFPIVLLAWLFWRRGRGGAMIGAA